MSDWAHDRGRVVSELMRYNERLKDTVFAIAGENKRLREALKPILPDKVLDEEEYSLVWNFHLNAAAKAYRELD